MLQKKACQLEPEITSMQLGDNEIKLYAYADDIDFFTFNVRSLTLIFQTCKTFQVYSSLKLSTES